MIRFDERNKRWRWEFDRMTPNPTTGVIERVRKTRLFPVGLTEAQARALGETWEAELFVKVRLVAQADGWDAYVTEQLADKRSWLHATVAGARSRSAARSRACGITAQELASIMRRSRGRCEVTGVQFQLHKPDDSRARPFFHSLDRRDASVGYLPHNCRLVCYGVNLAMSNWGEDVFAQLATGYVVNRYCALGLHADGMRSANFSAESPRTLKAVG